MKDNCMDCHQTGATYGGFIVAGSVYQANATTRYPNGTVILYKDSLVKDSEGNNKPDSVIATIEVDGVGNFYTTHPIDLSKGVYPSVTSQNGDTTMKTMTAIGSCNSCHGTSTQGRIVVK
jgi:hypothetical protein